MTTRASNENSRCEYFVLANVVVKIRQVFKWRYILSPAGLTHHLIFVSEKLSFSGGGGGGKL